MTSHSHGLASVARPARLYAWALGLSLLLRAASVAAQSSDSDPARDASARALFEEGVKFAEQSQWDNAVDRFRRALSLRNSSVITYNLATALIERGKLVEASELLRKVEQDEKVDASMKQSAQKQRLALATRIGRITVVVHDKLPADAVRLDDAALLDAQLGVEIPIDPGSHQVQIQRAGEAVDVKVVEVTQGGSAQVTLVAAAPLAPEAAATAPEAPQPSAATAVVAPAAVAEASSDSPAITQQWWFWTGVGAVVVGAVVVGVVLAAGSGSQSAAPAYKGDFKPGSVNVEVMGR